MNSIVQLIKRNARGFKSTRYFINTIYLQKVKLDFNKGLRYIIFCVFALKLNCRTTSLQRGMFASSLSL